MPKLSVDALKTRIADLQKKLAAAESSKVPAIKKVKALMKKLGVTVEDLSGGAESTPTVGRRRGRPRKTSAEKAPASNKTKKVAAKYRDDQGNTWSGRGKTPRWLRLAESNGAKRESFLIK
jgi:DNA-binding protein H-NS